jgi:hypothetical protein
VQRYEQAVCQSGKFINMNLKMSRLAFILPILILSASCKKNAATSSVAHSGIAGQWQWQYSTFPGGTTYPLRDSTVQIGFAADSVNHTYTFTLVLNNSERANGTWQWQDSILVLTSSAPINNADYAQDNIFNGTNPSEYFVKISQGSLYLSKHFIIPGATGPYSTPIEPQVSVFIYRPGSGGLSVPVN